MIIVEGPDGAGKTTLIQTLLRHTTLKLQDRAVTSEQGPVMDLREWTEKHLYMHSHTPDPLLTRVSRLYDRFTLISEPIYGPITRGNLDPSFQDAEWLRLAWAYLQHHQPFFIFCLPPLEEVKRNLRHLPQMNGVERYIGVIYWQYFAQAAQLYSSRLGHTVIYDYTASSDLGWLIDLVKTREGKL